MSLRGADPYYKIITLLAEAAQPIALSDIYAKTGTTLSHLRKLAKLDLIRFGAEEVWRDPLADRDFTPAAAPQLPAPVWGRGSRHPLSLTRRLMLDFFGELGFRWSEGPEIVDDWHNFGALHFEADHPARDMQDTFFVNLDPVYLLRTHTSSVQVKEMMKGRKDKNFVWLLFHCISKTTFEKFAYV